MKTLEDITRIYEGSDGEATKGLYAELQAMGPAGIVAMNLFRAQKCSERAKVYRGGNAKGKFKAQAYERKQWSMDNLCKALLEHGLFFPWGWARDPKQEFHCWVLYIELPTGQVSFHAATRGKGPDYGAEWDGQPGQSPSRILRWIAILFELLEEA